MYKYDNVEKKKKKKVRNEAIFTRDKDELWLGRDGDSCFLWAGKPGSKEIPRSGQAVRP